MPIETFESLVNHTLVGHYNSYSYTQNFGKNPLKDCQKPLTLVQMRAKLQKLSNKKSK